MWTDDHNPPTPTTQWKPGQTVEYTRTIFVPIYPVRRRRDDSGRPVLDRRIRSGCRSRARTSASAPTRSRSSSCCRRPRTCSPSSRTAGTRPKSPSTTPTVEWQWTKKDATLAFKNPKKDAVFYLDLDSPGSALQRAAAGAGQHRRPGRSTSSRSRRSSRLLQQDSRCRRRSWAPPTWPNCTSSVDKTFVPGSVVTVEQQGSAGARRARLPRVRRSTIEPETDARSRRDRALLSSCRCCVLGVLRVIPARAELVFFSTRAARCR